MGRTGDVDIAVDFENTEAELIPALSLLEHVPNAIDGSCGPIGIVDEFVNRFLPMTDIDTCDVWANPRFNHENTDAQGEWMDTVDVPAHNRVDINLTKRRTRRVGDQSVCTASA
jgi:hypothetical protein